ncbi:hypothetical protein DRN41_00865, partial [Thermococci archaeon]
MNPALQPWVQQSALPRKPERGPLGGKAGPTSRPNPEWVLWYFPLREVPPAVLLIAIPVDPAGGHCYRGPT